ncbi:hypothetical protein GL4_2632 [Methyloceanibacter caenitepidi]|uniref:Lipoprotein n=1 Tax=Methyloceanibacter caenitepidi TaxID=1384459 RepID=A0A0A8K5K1_9HYPH|nr:hypothetical protein GL4_2632 [Methyloceanibacter caenitepidi]
MRTIIALAVISATLALGGCFHMHQSAVVTELPPAPVPYK